jgi:small subunit ribosomal protein S1
LPQQLPQRQKLLKKSLSDYGSEGVADGGFDWASLEGYNAETKGKLETMYEKSFNTVAPHQIVEGSVMAITPKDVVINVGYKSEGVVPKTEFRYNPDLKVGESVEVYIESLEDKEGQLLLSHKKARAMKSWDRINTVFKR